jgi:hypothetical protein
MKFIRNQVPGQGIYGGNIFLWGTMYTPSKNPFLVHPVGETVVCGRPSHDLIKPWYIAATFNGALIG